MTLAELANDAVGNESSPRSYAARVEMDRRVAQAQIDAAIAQRDAASAQKATSWAALVFVPAALMGVVIGWLLATLMGAAYPPLALAGQAPRRNRRRLPYPVQSQKPLTRWELAEPYLAGDVK